MPKRDLRGVAERHGRDAAESVTEAIPRYTAFSPNHSNR